MRLLMPEISTSASSKLFYRKVGTGPALMLLHGFPEASNLWRKIYEPLSASFTLIMPDFPGSGESALEQNTSIAQMADCVNAIIESEQLERAVIAGHSMGGYVAFTFADQYPQKVVGLSIVHSIPYPDDEEKTKNRLKSIELIQKGGKSAFIRSMIPNLFAEEFKQSQPGVVEEQIALTMPTGAEALINYQQAMIGRKDQRSWLPETSIPIQWIVGAKDNVIYYKKILENCTKSGINFVSFYNNCGHMSMLEAPARLVEDLTEFTTYCYKARKMYV
jgi:pimeloyl-ACP methyl ester carboxylesterase